MTSGPSPHVDAGLVRELVAEVLRRLGPAAGADPANRQADGAAELAEPVITLALVERLQPGTVEVVVGSKAVITPSARDRARERGITIVRSVHMSTEGAVLPITMPFVIAEADCRGDVNGTATAIARVVPRAERLPAAGLAEVAAALATRAAGEAFRGILLTSRPALGVVVASRAPSLRAVTGRDATALAAAAAECAANLLVVDPVTFAGGIARACADFARRPMGSPPGELPSTAGCACHSHPQ